MKPEAQRMAIAEACGWYWTGSCYAFSKGGEHWHESSMPNYFNDLNAMHEAEKALTPEQRESFVCVLDRILHGGRASDLSEGFVSLHATAAQRAEAFLRTLNLWTDAP